MTHSQTSLDQDLRTALEATPWQKLMAAKIARINHPTSVPGERVIGWRVPEAFAGLSESLFLLEAVEKQVEAALTAPPRPDHAGGVERVRHLKRGTEYEVLGEAEAQVSNGDSDRFGEWIGLYEGHKLVIYRCVKTGKLWCRRPEEFRDGRFITVAPAQAPDKAAERDELKARMEAALDGKTRWSRDCHLSGEYLCGLVWPMVEEALTPKPTGTEAGRGVGAQGIALPKSTEDQKEYLSRLQLSVSDFDPDTMIRGNDPFGKGAQYPTGMRTVRVGAATPTPPLSPDSTGPAGDIETDAERLKRLKTEWSNHVPLFEGDHPWLLTMATRGIAALTPSAPIAAPVRDDGVREASQEELRQHWDAFCDADPVPENFIERMEEAGFAKLRKAKREDWESSFAADRGIEKGGYVWALTPAGSKILASLPAPAGDVPGEAQTTPDSTAQGDGTSQEGTR